MTEVGDTSTALRTRGRWKRLGLFGLAVPVVTAAAGVLVSRVTPRPFTRAVRWGFEWDADRVTAALGAHEPAGVARVTDQQYRDGDPDAHLDVYFPEAAQGPLPTVIWTHGGGWISCHKTDFAPYYRLLAAAGFTVVSLDYSLGPDQTYPTPVHQLNDAHAYLIANAERLHVDPQRIVLAGDSAGAQLSSQLAALITNPDYAREVGVTPALRPGQLRGVVLNCGVFDVRKVVGLPGILGWAMDQLVWSSLGTKDFDDSAAVAQMSTILHVTGQFPPTYISGGNADPLTDTQSVPLAERLRGLDVDVTTVFYPADHKPALGHEYQFKLDNEDGRLALERTIEFLRKHTEQD
ncbi:MULTISPECIES: alpha/beta hydrolase [unclassified Rhodococcus (in: high G+C Gram-positive bacteria)]|uniref:alpha/beta hydrolase n=1 Tax=unclassified Rhodococcus (in: high G+C Gram-positive bacteria) TaxID=192944 RepID=UPI000BC366B2|nr:MULTISPECIES: alpha/beta hydrolase [unclassified Rhodococcus (in: high G+C Gram-positive bacteria)]MBP1159204.1 acetyl esterase/lipase [Rhodococcus sp. PvR099]PTR41852.1 acetyl esterase/lipase [Rhodococcus sp. OK611]SNX91701.1 Acetyl esterase/lipase [Rhodococcus sp. OK270]